MRVDKFFSWLFLAGLASCGGFEDQGSHVKVRELTTAEALGDFDVISQTFREKYGPLEFKEARFGFKYEELTQAYRQKIENSTSETEMLGHMAAFIAEFQDGHLGFMPILNTSNHPNFYALDLSAIGVNGKVLISDVGEDLAQLVGRGDEVVSIDGTPVLDLVTKVAKYKRTGNDVSDASILPRYLFKRPTYMHDLIPADPFTNVTFAKADGTNYSRRFIWKKLDVNGRLTNTDSRVPVDPNLVASMSDVDQAQLSRNIWAYHDLAKQERDLDFRSGANNTYTYGTKPFFTTDTILAQYDLVEVKPSPATLARFGLPEGSALPNVYAALLKHEGKTFLLTRIESYVPIIMGETENGFTIKFAPDEFVNYYRALITDYQDLADAMILDQNFNPGGSVAYCEDMARLFLAEDAGGFVQANNSDRDWVFQFRSIAQWQPAGSSDALRYNLSADQIENAYDAGEPLGPFTSFTNRSLLSPDPQASWKKPILLLINEFSGSGGDAFPMMVQSQSHVKTFGRRTMGLGGSVVGTEPLPGSFAIFRVTRGLFAPWSAEGVYLDSELIENNGVTPDVEHIISETDLRSGFTDYFKEVLSQTHSLIGPDASAEGADDNTFDTSAEEPSPEAPSAE